jgi:hypothetical protein
MAVILLIILYTTAFIILIDRGTKNSTIRLSRKEIAFAFCFKVGLGILYGFVFKKYYGGDDTWKFFNDSLVEYNKLLFQTGTFFKEIIPFDSFHKYPGFGENFRDFLENLESNAITKSLAVFNIFSLQNYYADVVFFNLFSFYGSYLLFKLFTNTWKDKRLLIYLACFFIPSITFWLSGIRTDGLLILSIGFSLFYFNAWMDAKKNTHLACFLLGLLGVVIFRIQFVMVMLPFLFAWGLTRRFSVKPWKAYSCIFLISLFIFFGSTLFHGPLNFPSYVVKKQQEFMALKGNTVFNLNPLDSSIWSFLSTLPQAFLNTFFRPYPWEARGLLQIAASAEIVFFWVVFLMSIKNILSTNREALCWFVFLFAVCAYLLIGFTVPFPGAIVRYKVIPELLCFLVLFSFLPIKLKKIYI